MRHTLLGLLDDSCDLMGPRLMDDGTLLVALRDTSTAFVHGLDLEQQLFSPIGERIAGPGTLSVGKRAGTFVLFGGEPWNTFCPIEVFTETPPESAIPVGQVQIVRPDADSNHAVA